MHLPANGIVALGFIDNVLILAVRDSAEENLETLLGAHGEAINWANTHGSVLALAKYELTHFHENPPLHGPKLALRLSGPTCKYLGVVMDRQLTWKAHIQHLEKKLSAKLAILSALARSTWGINTEDLARIYLATLLPQFTYCALVWYVPNGGHGFKQKIDATIRFMKGIQARAAKIIVGALKTTSGATLDVELYLLPMQNQIDVALYDSLLCIITSPTFNLI